MYGFQISKEYPGTILLQILQHLFLIGHFLLYQGLVRSYLLHPIHPTAFFLAQFPSFYQIHAEKSIEK